MESLYVCLFSNGQIKVGRSINPEGRIASHADRLQVAGITITESKVFPCAGGALGPEAMLISLCAKHCENRYANEWFTGLTFKTVCIWAEECARKVEEVRQTLWMRLIAELKTAGIPQAVVAEEVGTSASSLSRLALGQQDEPLYSVAIRILALHAKHCQPAQSCIEGADPVSSPLAQREPFPVAPVGAFSS